MQQIELNTPFNINLNMSNFISRPKKASHVNSMENDLKILNNKIKNRSILNKSNYINNEPINNNFKNNKSKFLIYIIYLTLFL